MLKLRLAASIAIILLISIGSSCTKPQSVPTSPLQENRSDPAVMSSEPTAASWDPKSIAQALDGVSAREAHALLAQMGIQTKEAETQDDSEVKVEAKLYEEAAQARSAPFAAIQMNSRMGHSSYLIFRESDGRWSYIGDIDLLGQRAYKPEFRLIHHVDGNVSWFAVRQLAGYGTGLFQQDEVWYRLTGSAIQEDLRYAVKSTNWMSPSELVFSEVTGYSSNTGEMSPSSTPDDAAFAVEVEYHIEFTDSSVFEFDNVDDAHLFHAVKKIKYVWDEKRMKFEMDKSDSGYSDEKLLDFSPANMLRNFQSEIAQLGKSTLPVKRNWVKKLTGK